MNLQSLDETKAVSLFQVKFKVRRPNESQQWKVVEIISLEVGETMFMYKLVHPPLYILSRLGPSTVMQEPKYNDEVHRNLKIEHCRMTHLGFDFKWVRL